MLVTGSFPVEVQGTSGQDEAVREPLDASSPFLLVHHANHNEGSDDDHQDANDNSSRIGAIVRIAWTISSSAHLHNTPIVGKLFSSHHGAKEVSVSFSIVVTMLKLWAFHVVDLQVDNDAKVALENQVGVEGIARVGGSAHLGWIEVVHHWRAVSISTNLEVGS